MIPGLEERLLDGSDETIMHIGELVSRVRIHKAFGPESAIDTEGFFQCEGWRYKELERIHFRLDNTSRPTPQPTAGA